MNLHSLQAIYLTGIFSITALGSDFELIDSSNLIKQTNIMNQSEASTECIRTGNKLLRGELSAVQTYEAAIKKHPELAEAFDLDRISSEHRRSVGLLTSVVREMGGEPATTSGAWGVFANSVQTAANLFGAKSMVASLKEGEEHGRNDYEDALDGENTMETLKTLIRTDLLTKVEDHISSLERLQRADV